MLPVLLCLLRCLPSTDLFTAIGLWLEACGHRVAACMRHLLSPSSHQRIRWGTKWVSYCPRRRFCLDLGSIGFQRYTSGEGDKVTGSSREMRTTSVSHLLPGSVVGPPSPDPPELGELRSGAPDPHLREKDEFLYKQMTSLLTPKLCSLPG